MKPEVIVALDFDNFESAKDMVEKLEDEIIWYKVGLELFVSCGPEILEYLRNKGKKIFLDLKFHDIPNTVKSVVLASLSYGAEIINMHAQGGFDMMTETALAVKEKCESKGIKRPLLIAVTLLTSLDEGYLKANKLKFDSTGEYVVHLAQAAKNAGLDGVVSSAKETLMIKKELGNDFITVTPGIRPASGSMDDQKRVVTPKDAKEMGTDFIVVGRPITQAKNPKEAAAAIKGEMI